MDGETPSIFRINNLDQQLTLADEVTRIVPITLTVGIIISQFLCDIALIDLVRDIDIVLDNHPGGIYGRATLSPSVIPTWLCRKGRSTSLAHSSTLKLYSPVLMVVSNITLVLRLLKLMEMFLKTDILPQFTTFLVCELHIHVYHICGHFFDW